MPQITGSGFCEHCKSKVLTTRNATNHLAHAVISVFLLGLWVPVWLLTYLSEESPRCTACGTPTEKRTLTGLGGAVVWLLLLGSVAVASGWLVTREHFARQEKVVPAVATEADLVRESQERVAREKAAEQWGR